MAGKTGFHTTLSKGTGTPLLIGSLTSIGSPHLTQAVIEVTTHDSPDGYREYIGGLKDAGEVAITGNHDGDDVGQQALPAALGAGTVDDYTITFPDGEKWAFKALVTDYQMGAAASDNNPITFSATLKITGKPTFTPAA